MSLYLSDKYSKDLVGQKMSFCNESFQSGQRSKGQATQLSKCRPKSTNNMCECIILIFSIKASFLDLAPHKLGPQEPLVKVSMWTSGSRDDGRRSRKGRMETVVRGKRCVVFNQLFFLQQQKKKEFLK